MLLPEQAAAPPECGQQQQQPEFLRSATSLAIAQQPDAPLQGCPALEAPILDMQAGSQDAGLLLDASTLHGMLQQLPLESDTVLQPAQQVTSSLPASRPGSAGRQHESRKQSQPISATLPGLAACLDPHATTDEAQLGSGPEQGLAPPCRPKTVPTLPAVAAPQPTHASVAPLETANRGGESRVAAGLACASSRSLKTDILAKVDGVLSSNRLLASAAVSGGYMDSAGTAQAASAFEGAGSAGDMCNETKDRLRALLQGGGLQELAALLSSEDSEIGSDFSDDSSSPSGNGTSGSGSGSGEGAATSSEQASSYVEQEQVAGQSKVYSRLDITLLTADHALGICVSLLTGVCFPRKDAVACWSHRNLLASGLTW